MEFILLVFIILLAVGHSNLKFRLSSLEKKIKSIEEQGVKVVTDMLVNTQNTAEGQDQVSMPATQAPVYNMPSENTVKDHVTSEELGGRWLGKVGIFAVLIGVAFFIKYAFDNNWVGPLGRVCLGLSIGVLAIILGQLLRKTYENYSDVLMGGGISILYLSAYSGFFFYHLFEAPFAYLFLLFITFVSVVLSISNSAKVLAVVGIVGGLLTPLLISVTSPSYIEFLTYVLILDLGVVIVSYVYKWPELNQTAFVGTLICFMINMGQHVSTADAGFKMTSITFYSYAFIYFLIFLIASIAHHVVRKEVSTNEDVGFVFINGASHGVLGYILLNPVYPDLMGYFMLFLAILYSIIAYVSFVTHKEDAVLNKFLAGMAAGFLTAAIPLHFDGSWIAIVWFAEAIVFYLIDKSLRGQNLYSYGALVYILGLLQVLLHNAGTSLQNKAVFLNTSFGLYILAIISAYILAGILSAEPETEKNPTLVTLKSLYFGIANLLTLFSITMEISRFYSIKAQGMGNYGEARNRIIGERNTAISVFWMLYALVMLAIGFVLKIRPLRLFGLGLFFLTAIKLFFEIFTLGPLYAIVSSITLGILALLGSFGYAKYSEKLKRLM